MTTTTTTTAYSQTPPASRPLGVAIISILIGIYGFFVFLLGLLVAVASTLVSSFGGSTLPYTFGSTGVIAGIIIAIIGLIVLGLAVGLWHLRMWALVLTLLFLIFEIVTYGIAHAFYTFGFIVAILLFIYLIAVSRHFR
ncbi:MAG: hypothetical protein WA691_02255 [Thermoplasmata archaeon]